MKSGYRLDIDGIRAIAVLVVIFNHLNLGFASGGYIGVDVFFVISGYLITGNLYKEYCKNKSINFKKFYIRRAKRLLPALYVTLILVIGLGFLIFPSSAFEMLGESVVYTVFSISNILFWSQDNYFGGSSITKPLLHTWSLGIEEQFYAIWPLLLSFLFKFRTRFIYIVLLILFSISLILCSLFIKTHPSGVFYLLPFRILEFIIGGMVVFLSNTKKNNSILNEGIYLLGISLILIPVYFYDKDTVFPGVAAIVPCLGTALMIFSCRKVPVKMAIVLMSNASVYIGKISYSLYLFHWPIIVFFTYKYSINYSKLDTVIILLITGGVSMLSYHLVEQPFRRIKKGNPSAYFPFIIVTSFILLFISANIWGNNGWDFRVDPRVREIIANKKEIQKGTWVYANQLSRESEFSKNKLGLPKVMIIGDSLGKDLINSISQTNLINKLNISFYGTLDNCRYEFIGIQPSSNKNKVKKCLDFKEKILSSSKYKNSDIVIYTVRFPDEFLSKNDEDNFIRNLHLLSDGEKKKVIVFGNNMEYKKSAFDILEKAGNFSSYSNLLNNYQKKDRYIYSKQLKDITLNAGFYYIDRLDLMCPNQVCAAITPNGKIINYDEHHYTLEGSKYFGFLLSKDMNFQKAVGIE